LIWTKTLGEGKGENETGKFSMVVVVSATVFSFSAVVTTGASAASEWLLEGAAITTADPVESIGELLIADTGTGTEITCSAKFDGTAGPGSAGKIEKILSLTGVEEKFENLARVLVPAINCSVEKAGLCSLSVGALIVLIPIHLPWTTELLLPEATLWVNDITGGEPAYEVSCNTIIGTQTDVCRFKPASDQKNIMGGVEGIFEESESTNPKGSCSVGGEKTNLIVGKFITTPNAGGTLTVS
jgi:hypothetical protein